MKSRPHRGNKALRDSGVLQYQHFYVVKDEGLNESEVQTLENEVALEADEYEAAKAEMLDKTFDGAAAQRIEANKRVHEYVAAIKLMQTGSNHS